MWKAEESASKAFPRLLYGSDRAQEQRLHDLMPMHAVNSSDSAGGMTSEKRLERLKVFDPPNYYCFLSSQLDVSDAQSLWAFRHEMKHSC